MKLEFVKTDLRNGTPAEYASMNAFGDIMRVESHPEDPPVPHAERIARMQNIPPFVKLETWGVLTPDGQLIAHGDAAYLDQEENKHAMEFEIRVLPEFRQQGIAKQLLERIAGVAEQTQRRLLITGSTSRVPAGEGFLTAIGAQKGLEAHTNQLLIADLDRSKVQAWVAAAPTGEFELGFWDGPYPDAELPAIVELQKVMNTAPKGDLEIEDFNFTAEQVRQSEQQMLATGTQRWAAYVRDRSTGQFAGYTELMWNPNRPEIAGQGATGVFPAYRGKGLGRWLKAAMLERLLNERPQVTKVRTGNADSNAPMLKINTELGFKPYTSDIAWQVSLETIQAYLKR